MKILAPGRKSIRDDSKWRVKQWRVEPNAVKGPACGVGLHSIICGDPLKSPVMVFPCEVWEDECQEELGRDEVKARYRKQRILRETTKDYPIIVKLNAFLRSLESVAWFKPVVSARGHAKRKAYMRVLTYPTIRAAARAAYRAAYSAAASAAYSAAYRAAARAAYSAAYRAAYSAAYSAAYRAAYSAAARARSILTADLPNDSTWLDRWWEAWEMGFYPIKEDGDKLVVGWIKKG